MATAVCVSIADNEYVHGGCFDPNDPFLGSKERIHILAKRVFGFEYSQKIVESEITRLLKDSKTEPGILKALEYWYDVRGNTAEKAHGRFGIVDYVYAEAQKHFAEQKAVSAGWKDVAVEEKPKHVKRSGTRRPARKYGYQWPEIE